MRLALSVLAALTMVQIASTQERPKAPEEVLPRYGVKYRPKTFPQATPKLTLESLLAAADQGEVNYIVAHLMDPAYVDARLAERGRLFEPAVLDDLGRLRDFQKKAPEEASPETFVPNDPVKFRARVDVECRARAFTQFVNDLHERLVEDPEVLKDLRRFYRQGSFPESPAGTAKVGHPDVRDRSVFFKQVGDRWYIENRQNEERAPSAPTPPPPPPETKKE